MAGKLMRAVQYEGYGGGAAGLKHVEVPIPSPAKDEVLIKIEAISLNPVDWKIQSGVLPHILPRKFPFIPATDAAGEVVEVGAGVTKFKPGDKVVASLNAGSPGCKPGDKLVSKLSYFDGGALAEYGVAKEKLAAIRPYEVSAAESAGLVIAGLTALMSLTQSAGLRLDGTGPRKNILITAASGGVGHYAVQLAKLGNAHVTATCGARNMEFVKSLGADEVLDYKTPEGAALISPSGKKYDAVIHCAATFPWSVFEPNLSSNGKVIDITPGPQTMWTFVIKKLTFSKKHLVPLYMIPKAENLGYLLELVRDGKLKSVIDSRFPLSKAENAWAKGMEGHATGKIIVEP